MIYVSVTKLIGSVNTHYIWMQKILSQHVVLDFCGPGCGYKFWLACNYAFDTLIRI